MSLRYSPSFKPYVGYERGSKTKYRIWAAGGCLVAYLSVQLYKQSQYQSNTKQIMRKINIMPYGVLGTRLFADGSVRPDGQPPNAGIVIVDPAGLHHIHGETGPQGAGGASGSIYKWLGIDQLTSFPSIVKQRITRDGDACFYSYDNNTKNVVHVVGPDFRKGEWTRRAAVTALARAYCSVLAEYSEAIRVGDGGVTRHTLRMIPISGGIFSGPYAAEMPSLTWEAIELATRYLNSNEMDVLMSPSCRDISMCIFMEKDMPSFVEKFPKKYL
eukprot:PhF_6_TR19088/c0_g1_i1/m.28075